MRELIRLKTIGADMSNLYNSIAGGVQNAASAN